MLRRLFSVRVRLDKDTPEEVTLQDISNASFKIGIIRTAFFALIILPFLLAITAGVTLLFTGEYPNIELLFVATVGFLVIRLYLDSYNIVHQKLETKIASVALFKAVTEDKVDDESEAIRELLRKFQEEKEEENE